MTSRTVAAIVFTASLTATSGVAQDRWDPLSDPRCIAEGFLFKGYQQHVLPGGLCARYQSLEDIRRQQQELRAMLADLKREVEQLRARRKKMIEKMSPEDSESLEPQE